MADVTNDEFVRPAEIARQLGCSVRTIKRAIEDGKLPAVRVTSHTTRVNEADYLAFIGKSGRRRRARPSGPGGAGDVSDPSIPVPAA
jgi:excisionase family DNA binding protein